MPIREAELHIKVYDATGHERKPGGADKVLINGKKVSYDPQKGFVHRLAGRGDLLVAVAYDKQHELQQSFEFEAPAEQPTLLPFWRGLDTDSRDALFSIVHELGKQRRRGYLHACMSLTRHAGGHDALRSPTIFSLRVELHECREHIAVIGTDYWEGAGGEHPHKARLDFDRYALTYLQHLEHRHRLNVSSPVTVFDCQKGTAERWMRCAGKGWRRERPLDGFSGVAFRSPAPKWPTPADFLKWCAKIESGEEQASTYIGATDVYKYLHERGMVRPNTVVDFSVFSHSWAGGPILYNTSDSKYQRRSPRDLDMRSKDFLPANLAKWPGIAKAFASNGEIHIWGCFATTIYNAMVAYLAKKSKKPFVWVEYEDKKKKKVTTMTREEVLKDLNGVLNEGAYMKRFARLAGVPAFGGPPGYGADVMPYSTIPSVRPEFRKAIGPRPAMVVHRTRSASPFRRVYESAEMELRQFDEFGYLKYSP